MLPSDEKGTGQKATSLSGVGLCLLVEPSQAWQVIKALRKPHVRKRPLPASRARATRRAALLVARALMALDKKSRPQYVLFSKHGWPYQ